MQGTKRLPNFSINLPCTHLMGKEKGINHFFWISPIPENSPFSFHVVRQKIWVFDLSTTPWEEMSRRISRIHWGEIVRDITVENQLLLNHRPFRLASVLYQIIFLTGNGAVRLLKEKHTLTWTHNDIIGHPFLDMRTPFLGKNTSPLPYCDWM